MPEPVKYEDDALFNPETQHESSDVPVQGLLWFVVIFIVFAVIGHLAILFLYKAFVKLEQKRMEAPQTAVARPHDAAVPKNEPLLQPFPHVDEKGMAIPPQSDTPVVDLVDLRTAEDEVLRHYGWIDRQQGVVRIPIDHAKELLVARMAVRTQTGGVALAAVPATTGGGQ